MRSTSSRIAAVVMTLLLAACGGAEAPGSSTDSTSAAPVGGGPSSGAPVAPIDPVAAPAMASGTVTGFARTVAVDGVDYDAAADVTVSMDVDPRAESAGTMADVKLGQQVDVLLDASGQVTKVFVRATAIGPVESVAATSFKVLGQTIKVVTAGDARTVFEGVDDLAKLKIGDWVEVHGTLDAESSVVATRVEVKPAAGETKVR